MSAPPSPLYHYTSFTALNGIATSRTLWASAISYLNDSREYRHAVATVTAHVPEAKALHAADALEEAFLDKLSGMLDESETPYVFIFSLSANKNQLSQWRAYCPNGHGVAMGFNTARLVSVTGDSSFSLEQCVYKPAAQATIAMAFIEKCITIARSHRTPTSTPFSLIKESWGTISDAFGGIAARLKDPAFEEEAEWRLVSPSLPWAHSRLKVRALQTMLIPYYDLPIGLSENEIPLQTVVVGPNQHPLLAETAIRTAFAAAGTRWYGQLERSDVPLRTMS